MADWIKSSQYRHRKSPEHFQPFESSRPSRPRKIIILSPMTYGSIGHGFLEEQIHHPTLSSEPISWDSDSFLTTLNFDMDASRQIQDRDQYTPREYGPTLKPPPSTPGAAVIPAPNQSRSRQSSPKKDDWEKYRSTITHLYLDEDYTLKDIMQLMQ
jgi:hypothetical protein